MFPAPAGINRIYGAHAHEHSRVPRASGDKPHLPAGAPANAAGSPRARGSGANTQRGGPQPSDMRWGGGGGGGGGARGGGGGGGGGGGWWGGGGRGGGG
ncbi:hypothetical protein BSV07_11755, partial [Salmonella enterica subsp. enterica serovar Enteritidis]